VANLSKELASGKRLLEDYGKTPSQTQNRVLRKRYIVALQDLKNKTVELAEIASQFGYWDPSGDTTLVIGEFKCIHMIGKQFTLSRQYRS
jgi:hypothetical protein